MRNKGIKVIAGTLVIVGAVGIGIVVGKVSNKEQASDDKVNVQETPVDTNGAEEKTTGDSKDNSTQSKSEEVVEAPDNKDKTSVPNPEKPKLEEKTTHKTENKDTDTVKEEQSNSIYKTGISPEHLKEVKDKYYANMSNVSVEFGRHFIKTGDLLFSDDKSENESHKKLFYDVMDKNLNELWADLKIILSDTEMKKLTQEQVKWIKQKDNINKNATEIATAETNTIYARGKETYKRWMYLGDKYLNY